MDLYEIADKKFHNYKPIDLKKLEAMSYEAIGDLKENERVKLRKWEYLLDSMEIGILDAKDKAYQDHLKEGCSDSKAERLTRKDKQVRELKQLIIKLRGIVRRYKHDMAAYEYYYFKAKT